MKIKPAEKPADEPLTVDTVRDRMMNYVVAYAQASRDETGAMRTAFGGLLADFGVERVRELPKENFAAMIALTKSKLEGMK